MQHHFPACTMSLLNQLASTVLLFPANLLLLAATGLLLRRRWRHALWLTWLALALLWLFSTRSGSLLLVTPLENQNPPLTNIPASAQAIVVLGGGRRAHAPEYAHLDMPSYPTLARLQYAARLQRRSGLPLLTSGGKPQGEQESEAELMARSLQEDFGIATRWKEMHSATTAENAIRSASLLQQAGVHHIILVTDAMHMPRALYSFRRAGLQVTPAATVFFSHDRDKYAWLPGGEGLRRSNYALHEWIGLLWYQLRHGTSMVRTASENEVPT
jgi:uncharacterized SAM-binding protein YcdF (DUF218 family)